MTCVSPEARITLGLHRHVRAEHVAAWRRIVEFVHEHSAARICLQLGHSGPKGSIKLPWEGTDVPLEQDGWEVIAPSAVRYAPQMPAPRAMTRADMDRVRDRLRGAPRGWASDAGLRHARAALRARLPAVELHHAAQQPAHRRVRRLAREPAALSARGLPRHARGLARRAADVGAHLGHRLGRGRHHRRGRGGHRPRVRRRRRRHHPRVHRTDLGGRPAGLRPHVPDAVQRPDPQRARRADHRRRQHHRGRPGEQHHRRRSRRPVRAGAAAPERSVLDAARRRPVRLRRAGVAGAVSDRTTTARARAREKGHDAHDRSGQPGRWPDATRSSPAAGRASARRSPRRSPPRAPTSR